MAGTADEPRWGGGGESLEGWNVFTATLREEGIQTTFRLGATAGPDPQEGERKFRGQVIAILRKCLERTPQGETQPEGYRIMVATTPWKSNRSRIGLSARPMPEGCERVPEAELVQRVLQEVFGVRDVSPPTEEAVYVVDLMQPESAGRYQLFGPATSRREDRTKVLRALLEAVLQRTSADFPIRVGHTLRAHYLSNGKVIVSFSHRREQIGSEILEALPDLWSTAVQDLRSRLSV